VCERTFESPEPGDPEKRTFCCREHRFEWFRKKRKKRYVRRGRPPKDEKARRALLVR
jgi:hypothetical protein